MKLAAILGCCLVAGCAAVRTGPDVEKGKACLVQGKEAAGRGDHAAAVECYTAALEAHPGLPEAYYERGWSNAQLRRSPSTEGHTRAFEDQALEDYSMAIRSNPAFGDAYYNRAMILTSRARYKDAVDDFLKAVSCKPSDQEPEYWLGWLYERKFEDQLPLAMKHYGAYVDKGGPDGDVLEKVKLWRELQKQAAAPASKAPSPEDEKRAADLHENFKKLIIDGKTAEALKVIEELVSKHGHTQYVRSRSREFTAVLNALKK